MLDFFQNWLEDIMEEEFGPENSIEKNENEEREESLERLLKQINAGSYFPKHKYDTIKTLSAKIVGQLPESFLESTIEVVEKVAEYWNFSGSAMEGAALVRNLNPNLRQKYIEHEFDAMIILAKILKGKAREIILDLTYAKGFAWIKFKAECFGSGSAKNLETLSFVHEDSNKYLSSKSVKDLSINTLQYVPNLFSPCRETIEGPSKNIQVTESQIAVPQKKSVEEGLKTLHECIRYIEKATNDLDNHRANIVSRLSKIKKALQGKPNLINMTDIEELASVILPTNRERKNVLLQVHWMLLAFVNEVTHTILSIDRVLTNNDFLEAFGMFQYLFSALRHNPKKLLESLRAYFKYLLDIMPDEVYQKFKEAPAYSLSHFIEKCLYCQSSEMEMLFQELKKCKTELLLKSDALGIFSHSTKDKPDDDYKPEKICFNLDQVPTVAVEDWPDIAREWKGRCRAWPSKQVIEEIVARGCHIVPKPFYGQQRNEILDWRWSFSFAEMMLANTRTNEMDLSYLVLKSMFYRYIKPVEYNNETLTSYLIKTVMLWQCEENDATWWSERSVVNCISVLLEKLKESLYNKHLRHYFIRDINLLDNVADELLLYGQAILESICADPIICIAEVVEELNGFERPKTNNKISPKSDPDYKSNNSSILDVYMKGCKNVLDAMSNLSYPGENVEHRRQNFTDLMETIRAELLQPFGVTFE